MENDPVLACAEVVERGDPDRFMAAMAAPAQARKILFPVYAFNIEISRVPWVTNEPVIAQMRLQFWRDILDEIAQGKTPKTHDIVTPLSGFLDAKSVKFLDQLIEARYWDIQRDPFDNMDDFNRYIEKTAGNLMLVTARALGRAEENTVMDFAYAAGVANWLRAIPALEAAGRRPLPNGRPDAVREFAENALKRLKNARKNSAGISREARAALLSGWQAEGLLKQAISAPHRVAEGRLGLSEFSRRFSLLFKAGTGRF